MTRRVILIILCAIFSWSLFAQDIFAESDTVQNDIIKVNYTRKDARIAMLMSAILPGAGQFYSNKKAITTYIFPIIEAGLIYGYLDCVDKGKESENKYQDYATKELITITNSHGDIIYTGPRYYVGYQWEAQNNLAAVHTTDIYDNIYFKWNASNLEYNQHFYEDIGKYDKYIFGWADWHAEYSCNGEAIVFNNDIPVYLSNWADPRWAWDTNQTSPRWVGNVPTNPDISTDTSYHEPYSAMRAKYIWMRKDAELKYDKATDYNFAIVVNHLISSLDALRVTRKINRNYLSQNTIHLNYKTTMYNSHFTPMLTFNKRF